MCMNKKLITHEVIKNQIVLLSINRPEAANALSLDLLSDLADKVVNLQKDESVRVVIFTGAGKRAFCAGADLKERLPMSVDETRACVKQIGDVLDLIAALTMPTIAAINGVAFGGGLELALACDLRVMAAFACLSLSECALGVIPGAGGTQRLPRIVGVAKAKEMIFCAKKVGAQEALQCGLVNLVAKEEKSALEESVELAQKITKNAPLSLNAAKRAIDVGSSLPLKNALAFESECYETTLSTCDRVEGLRSFAEKRPPKFQGK